jgi:hypothetical protein
MSSPPSRSRASATKRFASSGVERSTVSAIASAPSCAAAFSTRSRSRLQIATRTPSAASAFAVSKPSPAEAAATAARFPAIPRSIRFSSVPGS